MRAADIRRSFVDFFRGADLVGVDIKGEATVGLWLEAAWQSPWDDGSRPGSADPFVRAVAGTDYTFGVRNGLYTAVQYYHDGSGATDETRYDLPGYVRDAREGKGTIGGLVRSYKLDEYGT